MNLFTLFIISSQPWKIYFLKFLTSNEIQFKITTNILCRFCRTEWSISNLFKSISTILHITPPSITFLICDWSGTFVKDLARSRSQKFHSALSLVLSHFLNSHSRKPYSSEDRVKWSYRAAHSIKCNLLVSSYPPKRIKKNWTYKIISKLSCH